MIENLADTLFALMPQPAFWMTPVTNEGGEITDFEYRYCNLEFYEYTRITPEQIIGKYVSCSPVISNQESRKKLIGELLNVYTTGKKTIARINNPDLNRYYSYTRNKVSGGVLTVLQDRTEEHLLIQQMEEQKRFMDNLLRYSSNGITVGEAVRDEQGQVVDVRTITVNDAALKLTGISKDIYLSKTGGEIDPGFLQSSYYKKCLHTLDTGEAFITQYNLLPTNRWLEVTVSRMDENRLIHNFTDITSIKNAQLAMERSSAQLEDIINRTQSGIFTLEPVCNERSEVIDFRFDVVNKALAAYVNQDPEALKGELASKYFTSYLTNGLFDIYKASFEKKRPNRFDFHYKSEGIDAWLDIQCTHFDGGLLVTFTDYTPIKQLQFQIEQKVEELDRSNKNLEQFAYAASHDMKEPIRKIHFFSDRLKVRLAEKMDGEDFRMFEKLERASKRMSTLIDDLLAYSHVAEGVIEVEQIDLKKKMQLVLEDLELELQEKHAIINVGALPIVKGNRRQFQQLFQNLISNAIKYSKAGQKPIVNINAQIVIGGKVKSDLPLNESGKAYHLLEVRDNGIGFNQEDAERIFNVFTRLHGKAEYSGTGVGLSIVKKVVENHSGYIWAESTPGEGSTFKILLPTEDE
ncbi:Histidine kinase-, DNA gyrase B-, and HSP90-like ATPase [Cnuella takakiae]|uniref:histidine kinase n=1 Tax=Cnuella takakiae TaxID=1302690 RepID=A0A1M4VV64_9BACT|nr:PAS domain-containing sensor histidine kinase [Cnuella takakiae]OLY92490.1 hypothetical protein BUE76_11775 [Cnuella takakiae]SHE72765.1 Histidine kinase-, DNA gyrase B-, and HSP90-like ATPase [Cnuella takakiae]